jgi:hypothetical protein
MRDMPVRLTIIINKDLPDMFSWFSFWMHRRLAKN